MHLALNKTYQIAFPLPVHNFFTKIKKPDYSEVIGQQGELASVMTGLGKLELANTPSEPIRPGFTTERVQH